MANTNIVSNDMTVSFNYTLYVDEKTADSTPEGQPLAYIHGHGQIIPGLEKEMTGLKVGDKKTVVVQPEEAYGPYDDESVVTIDKSAFPEDFNFSIGHELHLQDDESNQVFTGVIKEFDDKTVKVDLNHPLAGKVLKFDIEIVDIHPATQEELNPPHSHCDGCSGCEDGTGCH